MQLVYGFQLPVSPLKDDLVNCFLCFHLVLFFNDSFRKVEQRIWAQILTKLLPNSKHWLFWELKVLRNELGMNNLPDLFRFRSFFTFRHTLCKIDRSFFGSRQRDYEITFFFIFFSLFSQICLIFGFLDGNSKNTS